MMPFRDRETALNVANSTSLTVGAAGGLALGWLISRALPRPRALSEEVRSRAAELARRERPARLHRLAFEQEELDQLEDSVLRRFLDDEILGERAIDIGAISSGIIELSGMVLADTEIDRAMNLASGIPGVRTVINRLDFRMRAPEGLTNPEDRVGEGTFMHQSSRAGGMGRRRQGLDTDPDRRDDSQLLREDALAAADRDQFEDEGFAPGATRMNAAPEVHPMPELHFREDELDNQDPHGQHARRTLDSPPQALNTDARVGEGLKPGTRRRLEEAE